MFRPRVLAAGMLVTAVAVFASAVPASAHDQLLDSAPSPGERLSSPPEEVTLTFSDEPLSLDGAGMTVLVMDAEGRDWVEGGATVQERTVRVVLADSMPASGYEVRWQVVSADGHPISGVIPFTVGDAEPLAANASADPAGEAGSGGETAETGASQDQAAQEQEQIPRVVLVGAGGAAFAVAVLLLIHFLRRRARGDDGGPAA